MIVSIAAGLPSADTDGSVTMTLHQVNADGAGYVTVNFSMNRLGLDLITTTMQSFHM